MPCCGQKIYSTPENPIIIGVADESPARQVRLTITFDGWASGVNVWLAGTGVDNFVENLKWGVFV